MSITTWVKKNAKTVGKITLYGTGGVLLGWPLFEAADRLYKGESVKASLSYGSIAAIGYAPDTNTWYPAATRKAVMRDVAGIAAIIAASKL